MSQPVKAPAYLDYEARKTMSKEEVAQAFTLGAQEYDTEYREREYQSHVQAANPIIERYDASRRAEVKIIDVAAGTGLAACELFSKGFRNIDWLDPSEGMKEEAMKKNIYTNFFLEFMDGHRIKNIPTDTYDGMVVSGGFNEGLIPCVALKEMVRMVKPGGFISFTLNDIFFEAVPEYKDRLEPLMNTMEKNGVWKMVVKAPYSHYVNGAVQAVVLCFQVNVSEMTE